MGEQYAYPNGPKKPLEAGVFEVSLRRPLGIVFQEMGTDSKPLGVKVIEIAPDSNAAKNGAVSVDDVLVGVTAVRFVGAKFEREMYDASTWRFDRVVEAISSNEEKWRCDDVVLQFARAPAPEV